LQDMLLERPEDRRHEALRAMMRPRKNDFVLH
jgi:hypothetical protein